MTWYTHWFNHPLYLELYQHRDEKEARQLVDLVLTVTGLGAGSRILDVGAGNGRHAVEFASRGLEVVAMDLSPMLLNMAQTSARASARDVRLVRANMRRLPFCRAFEGVVQLFTAFGYFKTDEENARVIAEVAGIVKPGGWYVLDFLHSSFVDATLVPRTETRSRPLTVVQERKIAGGRVDKTITIYRDGAVEARFTESVRMYTPVELQTMFEQNGFAVMRIFGDYHGMPLHENSARCILVGRRNEDS